MTSKIKKQAESSLNYAALKNVSDIFEKNKRRFSKAEKIEILQAIMNQNKKIK